MIAGDLNVHHKKWLRYSNDNTTVGTDLKSFYDFHGMLQLVREPARIEYLPDLVITNICKSIVTVLPRIADHNCLLVKSPIAELLEKIVKRDVWMLKDADREKMERERIIMIRKTYKRDLLKTRCAYSWRFCGCIW